MSFTAQNVYNYCKSQLGVTADVYSQLFGYNPVSAYCCRFASAAFLKGGKNIGCWSNCGESSENGIQYGFVKAGFIKKYTDFHNLGFMWPIILDRPKQTTPFDHVCFSLGEYRNNNGIKEIKTIGGNPNSIVWFPVSEIIRAFIPNYDELKNGWIQESGTWHHYTNGSLDKNKWIMGEGTYTGKWFYVNENGSPKKNCLQKGEGKYKDNWYYLGPSGYPTYECKPIKY